MAPRKRTTGKTGRGVKKGSSARSTSKGKKGEKLTRRGTKPCPVGKPGEPPQKGVCPAHLARHRMDSERSKELQKIPKKQRHDATKRLWAAIDRYEKTRKLDLFEHFVKRAHNDDPTLRALMAHLLPKHMELTGETEREILIRFLDEGKNAEPQGDD